MDSLQDIHAENPCLQFPWHEKVHFSGWSLRIPSPASGLSMAHSFTGSLNSLSKSTWAEFNPAPGMDPSHLIQSDPQETFMHFFSLPQVEVSLEKPITISKK